MAINRETLQAALAGYKIEHERITQAMADIRARIKGGKASASSGVGHTAGTTKPKRTISAAARKRMAAAQKKRWAAYHKADNAEG